MTLARLLAAGLGTGFSPRAPGTAGSLLGLALGAGLLSISPYLLAVVTLGLAFLGMPIIARATGLPIRPAVPGGRERAVEEGQGGCAIPPGPPVDHGDSHADPGWVVIDEVAGQCLALLALPRPSWGGATLAFLLFRALDILKPGPIGWADRQGGAWGIMADDLIAGFIACLLVGAAHVRWPGFI